MGVVAPVVLIQYIKRDDMEKKTQEKNKQKTLSTFYLNCLKKKKGSLESNLVIISNDNIFL